ncbi:hypothetical protein MGA5115_00559 [Marinomonas gallaica]|uniref:Lipoprotein n=1 Tax=Marinomonas gallaica TaxID=1806667 RepID=A0A1C3JMM6_9GAMM|nr:hypothetical protein [Marinomonas gallaica]MCO4785132.1 hypothetical protein [Marinomonas atlantica]SBT16478.1 hypothetical protein MGA5115_00559 [Marinomonas gallaica]SBT20194.1 hypothetical protein MGA5116_00777 [Marinomonas gallaica]
MKLGLLSFTALWLTGCTLIGGSNSHIQEAYYVPVITGDRPVNASPKAYPVHRSDEPSNSERAFYIPVITD